jgi:hypothetical protein
LYTFEYAVDQAGTDENHTSSQLLNHLRMLCYSIIGRRALGESRLICFMGF